MRMVRWSLFALSLVLVGVTAAQADLYLSHGQDTFSVRVTNRHFKPIYDARGMVWVSGNSARIEVSAPGYRSGATTVFLNPNTHYYYATVTLDDPSVWVAVKTTNGTYVEGATTNTYSQSMYWGDEYGLRVSFPKKGFEKLTERQIEVRVNYLHAFVPKVYLSDAGPRWNLEVIIKRRDLRDLTNTIEILLTPDPEPATPATPAPTAAIEPMVLAADYQANRLALQNTDDAETRDVLTGRLESLARRIRDAVNTLDAGETARLLKKVGIDSPLGREIRTMQSFNDLHR
ncbi:MAG: hypothetical protein OZSIB_3693 [Candidatus Ozemobacter sibiricus]|uniref:Uncharacterized protein n=1 Tax=Candidatus Ozemobacter sibiricus TaxID=2268124 RepID=A0A367ZCY2_9BACT|nr:MAG: hypothetical protein OZSIB_3693 [Candidatus Ozemobacter sibiricus]